MEVFQIEFDTPAAVFYPGQPISGKVIIQNQSNLNALSLKICIHGEAKTHWKKYESRRMFDRNGRFFMSSEHINYTSKVDYLKGVSQPWTSLDGNNKIPAGMNVFPFLFQLPLNCPPSFEGTHGHVRYSCHVELDRPWRINADVKKVFSVIPMVDLNRIPKALSPLTTHSCKHSGFLSTKEVKMKVTIPKQGFIPGEVIPITIHLDNHTKKPVHQLEAKLIQHVHYTAQQENSHLFPEEHCHKHCEHKTAKTTMAEVCKSVKVECCSKAHVELALVVPNPCVSSFMIPILEVDYFVEVKAEDNDWRKDKILKCELPVFIGTLPIRFATIPQPSSEQPPNYEEFQKVIPPPAYSSLEPGASSSVQPSAPELEHF